MTATIAHIADVVAGREVRQVHAEALSNLKGGRRLPYHTVELPDANYLKDVYDALDTGDQTASGWSPNSPDSKKLVTGHGIRPILIGSENHQHHAYASNTSHRKTFHGRRSGA